jgi:hypothetical protein
MSAPAWLSEFCSTSENRPALQTPFTYPSPDGVLTCATNGHRIIMLSLGDDTGFAPAPDVMHAGLAMALEPKVGPTVALEDFRAFLSARVPDQRMCQRCKGTGLIRCGTCGGSGGMECVCTCGDVHDTDCDNCEDGKAGCPACRFDEGIVVKVGSYFYDARYFGRPMEALAGERAMFSEFSNRTAKDNLNQGIALIGDGWRLVVMSRRSAGANVEGVFKIPGKVRA